MAKRSPSSPPTLTAPPRIAIITGKDRARQNEVIDSIRAQAVAEGGAGAALGGLLGGSGGGGEVETIRLDCAASGSVRLADVLDECRSPGLMPVYKLVIVDNAELLTRGEDADASGESNARKPSGRSAGGHKRKTNRELLEDYARNPEQSATLVLRTAGKWVPGTLDKLVAQSGLVVKCEPMNDREARTWVRARAQRLGSAFDNDAIDLLVSIVGTDQGRLSGEVDKLALVQPGAPVTAAVVARMVGHTREEDVWVVQRAILGGPASAVRAVSDAIETSRHAPALVSYACMDLARKLHGVCRGLRAGEQPGPLMGKLKIWGDAGYAIVDAARRMSPDLAGELLAAAVRADVRMKTGFADGRRACEAVAVSLGRALEPRPRS